MLTGVIALAGGGALLCAVAGWLLCAWKFADASLKVRHGAIGCALVLAGLVLVIASCAFPMLSWSSTAAAVGALLVVAGTMQWSIGFEMFGPSQAT